MTLQMLMADISHHKSLSMEKQLLIQGLKIIVESYSSIFVHSQMWETSTIFPYDASAAVHMSLSSSWF